MIKYDSQKKMGLVKLRGYYQKYIHTFGDCSYQKNDEVFARYQEATGEEKRILRNKLVEMNMPLLLHFVSQKFNRYYIDNPVYDVDDIFQEGSLLLLEAIETYDASKGLFSSYFYDRVRGRLFDKNTIANSPVHFVYGKVHRYRRIKFYIDLGYDDQFISDRCQMSIKTIQKLRPLFEENLSYEVLIENLEDSKDYIQCQDEKDGELYLARMLEKPYIERRNALLQEALNTLSERDRALIIKKYGLDGNEPMDFKQLKEEFGYKGSLVYERRRIALKRLAEFPELKAAFLEVDVDYDYSLDEKTYSLQK